MNKINSKIKLYKAKIGTFKRQEAINKDLCLLVDVVELAPYTNKEIPFRDHLYIVVNGKDGKLKIDKTKQGYIILFYAEVYEYKTSKLKTQKGLKLKYPQKIVYKKFKNKRIKK